MRTIRLLIITGLLLTAFHASAVSGWSQSSSTNGVAYTPTGLASGKTFEYRFYGPIKTNAADQMRWFRETTLALQQAWGAPLGQWQVKKTNGKFSVSDNFLDQNGNKIQTAFEGGTLSDGNTYLMHMRSNLGIVALVRYGLVYDTLLKEVESTLRAKDAFETAALVDRPASSPTPATAQSPSKTKLAVKPPKPSAKKTTATTPISKLSGRERREAIEKAIRVSPGEGVSPKDIEAIWAYSRLDLIWGGVALNTYLLLKDGSVYTDCQIPPNELNVARSRELQPERWTKWKQSWGKYQYKHVKKQRWEDLPGEEAGLVKNGTPLAGRFVNAGGSQYSGSWKKTITFYKNGRFEMSSSSMRSNSGMGGGDTAPMVGVTSKSDKEGTSSASVVIGANVGGGSSSKKKDGSKNTGRYTVNKHSITMAHDNGWNHTELFLYEEKGKKGALVYGDDIYYLDKD